jgi:hypothetical protein
MPGGSITKIGRTYKKWTCIARKTHEKRAIHEKTLPPSMSRMSENVGASTSHNPKGLHGLYGDNLKKKNFLTFEKSGNYVHHRFQH